MPKKEAINDEKNSRKYKRVLPTRIAGAPANPAFDNPADELFENAFANREKSDQQPISEPESIISDESIDEVIPVIKEKTKKLTTPTPARQGRQPSIPTLPSHGQEEIKSFPISPVSNYQKVTNTITREAIPGGLFKPGKTKQIYDVLYSLTRGAINPTREVRISKPKLRELAGVGSRITMDACVEHLVSVGLIRMTINDGGQHAGNTYEIFTPEEIGILTTPTPTTLPSHGTQGSPGTHGSDGSPAQNLGGVGSLESRRGSHGHDSINTGIVPESKTLFKTLSYKIDDDAPVISLLEMMNGMAQKLTGNDLSKKDFEKLLETAQILIDETVIAAARTGSVSSPIAFMNENLRRRLYSKPRSSGKKEDRPKHLNVGKASDELSWTPQTPLDQEQRERTLQALKEAQETDSLFFREFKTFGEIEYTPEDFKWLTEKLEK